MIEQRATVVAVSVSRTHTFSKPGAPEIPADWTASCGRDTLTVHSPLLNRDFRMSTQQNIGVGALITPEQLLAHWQGHRKLTRRMIEAFPEDKLFSFSLGGMRTFAVLVKEFIGMAVPTVIGIAEGRWDSGEAIDAETKADLLQRWDRVTDEIESAWRTIPASRWQEVDTAFGQWEMPMHGLILYVIDNEIHHRGQGYVYLRALGIEPPPFYER